MKIQSYRRTSELDQIKDIALKLCLLSQMIFFDNIFLILIET